MDYKTIAISSAKAADKIILDNYKKIGKVTEKYLNNFVTNVDLAVEKAVMDIIRKNTDHCILSEESGFTDNSSEYKWILDPIDGTHNYIHGIPMFGISIALEYKKEVILGVITLPLLRQFYFAEKGKGAFLNGKGIHVSKISNLRKSLLVMDSSLHRNSKEKMKFLSVAQKNIFCIRMSGCAVFDLSSIASGNADEYIIFQTHPWDVAAGFLLVKEAGGKITDFDGKAVDHYSKSYVITNGRLHKPFLKMLTNN